MLHRLAEIYTLAKPPLPVETTLAAGAQLGIQQPEPPPSLLGGNSVLAVVVLVQYLWLACRLWLLGIEPRLFT